VKSLTAEFETLFSAEERTYRQRTTARPGEA
jgi:hypothetical protein